MIPLMREYYSIIKISISNSIMLILNSFESQNNIEQTYYAKLYFMEYKLLKTFVNSVPYLSLENAIWTLFVLDITISEYQYLKANIKNLIDFKLNGIKIPRLFQFSKKLSYLSVFSQLFSKNEI